jgi:mannose/cellobiose epimerase-like protein (N-acyl-D-glucosamine 2-epimerase family)
VLAALRLQYPDVCTDRGFVLLHPETGDAYTGDRRHLVATCRAVSNFALGSLVDGPDWCLDATAHGLEFLDSAHSINRGDGYALLVDADGEPVDRLRSAYAHAFVVLAYARATEAGIGGAPSKLDAVTTLLEDRFVEPNGLVRSDCTPDWNEREPYRGQNANMHACEAYIAAHEATGDGQYLDRAGTIARRLCVELAAETDGLLWEHYTDDWTHDFAYNEDQPTHQFRPPGYQPGHHAEWAKLLALLDRHGAGDALEEGWYRRAVELFDAAVDLGWTGGGFVYTATADGEPIVSDQYGWALAEAIGAAAALAERADALGETAAAERFVEWHGRLTERTERFRGPAGLWYEKRTGGDDTPVAPDPPGVEPDYHPLGAWYETWRSARLRNGR